MNTVLFITYTNDSYFETVRQVYDILPYFHSLDYLHLFYLKQVLYTTYLSMYTESSLSLLKPIIINIQLDFIFSSIFNK